MRSIPMVLRILLEIVAVWLLLSLIGLAAASISGKVKRAYPVLPPEQVLAIHGEERPVSAWAAEYQPVMTLRSDTKSPPLLFVFYEVVDNPEEIAFIYYHVWEDEIHPNPVYHFLYRTFRAAYYGSPVRDIEYFQVGVNQQTGEVTSLLFETSPGKDYYVTLSEHVVERLTRTPSGLYSVVFCDRDGKNSRAGDETEVRFEDLRPVVGVATWNHLTQLVSAQDTAFDTPLPAELKYLNDAEYQSYKFVRKSQGDFKTKEPPLDKVLGGLSALILAGPIYLIMRLIQILRRKR